VHQAVFIAPAHIKGELIGPVFLLPDMMFQE
jgi:hypothetical protein